MIHLPVNHPLRPLYRLLAGFAGAYVLLFGIFGVVQTWGTPFFGRGSIWVLGLRTNLAFSLMSVVAGAIILLGAIIGGNLDRFINLAGGVVFLTAGMVMMTLLQTDANLLNFSIATCVVSFIIGLILGTAGLYGKVGPPNQVYAEEAFRHGGYDPVEHIWQDDQGEPHRPDDPSRPERHRFA